MFKFTDNDTVAIVFLGTIAIVGLIMKEPSVANTALGAIGGYVGSQVLNKSE